MPSLFALALTESGGATITLTPGFATGTTTYTASVANGIDTVTLAATKNDSNATCRHRDPTTTRARRASNTPWRGRTRASFDIDPDTGQLPKTKTGVDYNHEATKNSYSVTVKADDDNGGTLPPSR